MNDRVRIKLHMVEEDFGGLAPMLYDMLAADRPSVDRLTTVYKIDPVDRHPSYLSLLSNQQPQPPVRHNFMADESQDSYRIKRRVISIRRYEIRNGEKVLIGEEFPEQPDEEQKTACSEVTAACNDIKAKIDQLIRMNNNN